MNPLKVTADGLQTQASRCAELATELMGNTAPAGAGSSWLATTAAVNTAHAGLGAAMGASVARMGATATTLAGAGAGFTENETHSAAALSAITQER
jgi:hypothetical protein